MRERCRQGGFTLMELLMALSMGLLLWGVVMQALLVEGRVGERLVRVVRERSQQRRALALVRGDALRAERVELGSGVGAACGLGGRTAVLQLRTPGGVITYTVGAAPSAIWRGQVLMRCGPAFGLDGEPSAGAAQNRVVLDGLPAGGFLVRPEDGALALELLQEFTTISGGPQRIRTAMRVAAMP